ncbi:uncharacterized protein LOC119188516 [Manduca sexta]|uniref:uncharacterized protein LOC119188516 n=1 Tax=Manduca sexta TaxID=7130 RepID=UPI00189065B4|nr:uncharacterized protein LOC119188516 [Manduca sexta]
MVFMFTFLFPILEGVTWDEASKLVGEDAVNTHTGDHVVLMGAASKGIIQRGYQHNATVYSAPYARNPSTTSPTTRSTSTSAMWRGSAAGTTTTRTCRSRRRSARRSSRRPPARPPRPRRSRATNTAC